MKQTKFNSVASLIIHSLPNQMLALDKILTTVTRTAFVHMWRHNQHKFKDPRKSYKHPKKLTYTAMLMSKTSLFRVEISSEASMLTKVRESSVHSQHSAV